MNDCRNFDIVRHSVNSGRDLKFEDSLALTLAGSTDCADSSC